MGTSNFWQLNTSCIYACGLNDEYGEYDECEYDDTRDMVSDELEDIAKINNRIFDKGTKYDTSIRDATSIGIYEYTLYYYGIEWDIRLMPQTIAGHYEGFTLDFDIEIEHSYSCDAFDDIEDLVDDLIDYYDIGNLKGIVTANKSRVIDKIQKELDKMKQEVESVFKQYSTPLEASMCFNNGETIYEKIAVNNDSELSSDQDGDIDDATDDSFPIIYTGSHYTYPSLNREAFDKVNDILLDEKNPYYDIFNEEKLYLDDTNGFISLVQTDHEDDFSNIAQEIADYITSNVGFSGESFIYIGDSPIQTISAISPHLSS